MHRKTRVNCDVLPEAFSQALRADLSVQYDREEMDRWLSEGGLIPRNGGALTAPSRTNLADAVDICTSQMKMHGYYPETVLATIKSAVRDAAVPLVAEHLVKDIVADAAQWCIAAYFEPRISARGTPSYAGLRGSELKPQPR